MRSIIKPADSNSTRKYSNGPVSDRSTKDVICLLLFLATLVVAVYLMIDLFKTGDLNKLLQVRDMDDQLCG